MEKLFDPTARCLPRLVPYQAPNLLQFAFLVTGQHSSLTPHPRNTFDACQSKCSHDGASPTELADAAAAERTSAICRGVSG